MISALICPSSMYDSQRVEIHCFKQKLYMGGFLYNESSGGVRKEMNTILAIHYVIDEYVKYWKKEFL
jgi:hypothetical protein